MDKKTEAPNFASVTIAKVPGFMEQEEGIKWIKKSDLSRLFNNFAYDFTEAEFNVIMDAHAKGPVAFIQALEKACKPICDRFFNTDMTQLKEPFRKQIRAYFGESRIDDAVRVFDEHTNIFLQPLFENIIYDEDNPLETEKPKFEAGYKESITPIQDYKLKKKERVEALLKIVQEGRDTDMPAAVEQFKRDAAQDNEDFLVALTEYAEMHDEKKPDGTPKYPDGTRGKLPLLREEDKKAFRSAQAKDIDFIAECFSIIDDQKLVNETLNGIVTSYELALTSYPSTKRAEKEKQDTTPQRTSTEIEALKNTSNVKEQEETQMVADVMADIGVLVNAIPTKPAFRHIFNDSRAFLANSEASEEAEKLLLYNRKRSLEAGKDRLLSEIDDCTTELVAVVPLISETDVDDIRNLIDSLDQLYLYIDSECFPRDATAHEIAKMQKDIEDKLSSINPLIEQVSQKQLDSSWRAGASRALTTFLNAIAYITGYTSLHQETAEDTLQSVKEHSQHAVQESITTFKDRLQAIKNNSPPEDGYTTGESSEHTSDDEGPEPDESDPFIPTKL
jgi:hypothetical protein